MIKNDIISLRLLENNDIDFLYKWENDTTLWKYGDTRIPLSKTLLENYISNYDADILTAKQLRFMIIEKKTETTIGAIDLYDIDIYNSKASIGILIIPQWQNKGYAQCSIKLLEDYAYNIIGLSQIAVYTTINNQISISLFEKCGYTKSGLLKNWCRIGNKFQDVVVMQHFLNNTLNTPSK